MSNQVKQEEFNYQIKMLSDWHIGSGLDSATDVDALVLKDEKNLPYIPGKTIKGLIKDAVQDIIDIQTEKEKKLKEDLLKSIFGKMKESKKSTQVGGPTTIRKNNDSLSGDAYFSNVTLPEKETNDIHNNGLSNFLYRNVASTAIGENGIAKEKSLRVMQVTVPMTLEGKITQLSKEEKEFLEEAVQLVRHLGVNRNRGLGRCHIIHQNTDLKK